MTRGPLLGEVIMDGRYQLVAQVKGSVGQTKKAHLGQKGLCRFCGERDPRQFRKIAHTFPEALGNKWVFSFDECDGCNALFSNYENELAKAMSPFLTLGGIPGKRNNIRQTGRSAGNFVLSRRQGDDRPHILMAAQANDWAQHISADPLTRRIRLSMPIAGVPFKPRHAYKALMKMGTALLPSEELANFTRMRQWLRCNDDHEDFPNLEVGLSFASIANAPQLVVGTLLRRLGPADPLPYMIFIYSAGSICLQVDLMPDSADDHLGIMPPGRLNIRWSNVIGAPGKSDIKIDYGQPIHLNWSAWTTSPQPIASIVLDFCLDTNAGVFTPIFR